MPQRLRTVFACLALVVVIALALTPLAPSIVHAGPAAVSHSDSSTLKPGKAKKDKPDKEKKDKKPKKDKVEALDAYVIDVSCSHDSAADQSTCQFVATAPSGGKKINHFVVPDSELCAPVVRSDGAYVDPDPNAPVSGYSSNASKTVLVLTMDGNVEVGEAGTYWIKAANNVFPATGAGLVCAAGPDPVDPSSTPLPMLTPAPNQPTSTPATRVLTPEPSTTTGEILVYVLTCNEAAPPLDFDWYGECEAAESGLRFRLTSTGDTSSGTTGSTDAGGGLTFPNLDPGTYHLMLVERNWCKAQSDNVDADGNLIVATGEQTKVWIFTCPDAVATPTP